MAKQPLKLKVRIPRYVSPRNRWRRQINEAVIDRLESSGIKYSEKDRLELVVLLYLEEVALLHHDVDNRLKDIMDALQGRAGGPKTKPTMPVIIPNDHQIYKVTIEKRRPPWQSKGAGHLIIRKYKHIAR